MESSEEDEEKEEDEEEELVIRGGGGEMEGGYRETESGLDASFFWSHDKSEEERSRRRKQKSHARKETRERELVVSSVSLSRNLHNIDVSMEM